MKRVRCPKCDEFITFDENKYEPGQRLVFVCPACSKQFAIKLGVSKLRKTQKEENEETPQPDAPYGSLTVIENVFHYKQIIPLHLGENAIGRYQKGNPVNCPIETVDPSVDLTHCHINVSRDKNGKLKYVLRDGPSYTGTFVGTELLGDRERRVIYNALHVGGDHHHPQRTRIGVIRCCLLNMGKQLEQLLQQATTLPKENPNNAYRMDNGSR